MMSESRCWTLDAINKCSTYLLDSIDREVVKSTGAGRTDTELDLVHRKVAARAGGRAVGLIMEDAEAVLNLSSFCDAGLRCG